MILCNICRLESQCVTAISFVKNEPELLDSPIWILIINIVALEMLKAKLPQGADISIYLNKYVRLMTVPHYLEHVPPRLAAAAISSHINLLNTALSWPRVSTWILG